MTDKATGQGWMLGVDTALNGCQLVLYRDGAVFKQDHPDMRGQTEHLLPMLQALLTEAEVKFEDISQIVAITGPGSFTGIRIGLAVVNALLLSLHVPLLGIDSFTAFRLMAAAQDLRGKMRVVIESYRDEAFVAGYLSEAADPVIAIVPVADVMQEDVILIGNGLEKASLTSPLPYRLALEDVLKMISQYPEVIAKSSLSPLAPYYMREADTSESKQKTWSVLSTAE